MLRTFCAITALAVLSACGGTTEIIVAKTHHTTSNAPNELHPGIRHESGPFIATAYHNSEGRLSFGAGVIGRAGAGFCEAGLVTGYDPAPIIPFGRCGVEHGPLRAFIFPDVKHTGEFGPGFGVETVILEF